MSGDGFALRHRGVHLPDHLRRLEFISSSPRSPQHTGSRIATRAAAAGSGSPKAPRFQPLAPPQFAHDFLRRCEPLAAPTGDGNSAPPPSTADLANAFANLSVWIDASLRKCAFHAGFDKIHVYALFLECFLDEVAPQSVLVQRHMQELHAYIQYLSTACSSGDTNSESLTNRKDAVAVGDLTSAVSPRQPAVLRLDRLSPKANFQAAALVPHMLQQLSPRSTPASPRLVRGIAQLGRSEDARRALAYPKRKRIVQMSDHEEHVLELALYFDETLRTKMAKSPAATKGGRPSRATTGVSMNDGECTAQWALLSTDERHRVLRRCKKQLAHQAFFPCSGVLAALAPYPGSGGRSNPPSEGLHVVRALIAARAAAGSSGKGGGDELGSSASTNSVHSHRYNHKTELASYFSLVLLCLHESVRRVGVFSLELAEFAWKLLCEDTLALCDDMFASILEAQKNARQQVQDLKRAKAELQQQILDTESEILRLQTQNMRSLSMYRLEKLELEHLEREEEWHGHCKALIVDCVSQLRDVVRIPTWLHMTPHSSNEQDADDGELVEPVISSGAELPSHAEYQRLAPGFAAFDFQPRLQVVYISHLAQLCRSFLHLHERRCVRDVMNSTSTTSPGTANDVSAALRQSTAGSCEDWPHGENGSFFLPNNGTATNAMEKISLSELHTLREINDALRAVEILYAETGATSGGKPIAVSSRDVDTSASKQVLRRPRPQTRSIGTQFPVVGTSSARSFLRSLAYCTIVATTFSLSSSATASSSFAPPRMTSKLLAEIGALGESIVAMGSGRRRSSMCFRAAETRAATASALSQPQQPQIRLNKAVLKLPRHIEQVLVLALVRGEESTFPADSVKSVAASLTGSEIVEKIHWIYRLALDSVFGSSSSSAAGTGSASDLLPASLSDQLTADRFASWSCANFVDFVYAGFLDAENGNLETCEREFVRFFASIQLFLTNALTSSTSAGAASAGVAIGGANTPLWVTEAVAMFALLVKLLHLPKNDHSTFRQPQLPSRVFPVLFYVQRVLLHVSVAKKQIETSGFSLDVWTLAPEESGAWGRTAKPSTASSSSSPPLASPSKRASAVSAASSLFVLLESVKVLMMHVVSFALATDVGALLEERYQFLLEKSTTATVSLMTPTTPGLYNPNATPFTSSASNGHLAETQIVPMDLAVATIVRAWIQIHNDVEHRLGITLQGALADAHGRISFEEFAHVMVAHSSAAQQASTHHSSSSALSSARLAQIYATAQARESAMKAATGGTSHWTYLLDAVVETVDIMGMHERFLNVDFRSIQHSLLAPSSVGSGKAIGGSLASSWLLGSAIRGGATTHALLKSWNLHHKSMSDHVALAFQADSALDGVRCWQTGRLRLDKVQRLLRLGRSSATGKLLNEETRMALTSGSTDGSDAAPTTSAAGIKGKGPSGVDVFRSDTSGSGAVPKLDFDELSVAWKAYQLLQWDHARAHQFADQVRLKQQRMQKNAGVSSVSATSSDTARLALPSSPASATQGAAAKEEEIRAQLPLAPSPTHHRRHRA